MRIRTIAVAIAVLGVVGIGVMIANTTRAMRPTERVLWDTASGTEAPGRFLCAMFPVADAPGDTGPIFDRMIMNSVAEIGDERDTFEVYDDTGALHMVPKRSLGYTCDDADVSALVEELNRTLGLWGDDTDYRSASFDIQSTDDGAMYVLVVESKKGYIYRFEYAVRTEVVVPLRWTVTGNPMSR